MPQLSSKQKHDILTMYANNQPHLSFESIARQHNIKGGKKVISRWWKKWDGTPDSLMRREGSGRPKALTSTEVRECIQLPILHKNRSFEAIHYHEIQSSIKQKIDKNVSIQTVRRYGKEQLDVKQKRTKKRTANESNDTARLHSPSHGSVPERQIHERDKCVCVPT
jgi:hypothetical protein